MYTMKITTIGNSLGVIFPKELLAKMRVGKGDQLFATETPDGIRLALRDEGFVAQMGLAEMIMREDRAVLAKLAE